MLIVCGGLVRECQEWNQNVDSFSCGLSFPSWLAKQVSSLEILCCLDEETRERKKSQKNIKNWFFARTDAYRHGWITLPVVVFRSSSVGLFRFNYLVRPILLRNWPKNIFQRWWIQTLSLQHSTRLFGLMIHSPAECLNFSLLCFPLFVYCHNKKSTTTAPVSIRMSRQIMMMIALEKKLSILRVNRLGTRELTQSDWKKIIHDSISILNIAPSWILLLSNLLLLCVFVFLIARIFVLLTKEKIIQLWPESSSEDSSRLCITQSWIWKFNSLE